MARDILRVWIDLDRIHCYDEGDGWGSAEPYLWTVFFKIDGDTVSLTDSLTLTGSASVEGTPGSHGNLSDTDVDAGDDVSIPSAIGEWDTFLKPIPVADSVKPFTDDLPGIVGVVCVLMEEDNVSDDGAEAGHAALNAGVQSALDNIIATRSFSNQDVTQEEIDSYMGQIQSGIESAIKEQQNVFENIWSWLNEDDLIGSRVWFWKQDDLAGGTTIDFSQRWQNEGDWELYGQVTSSVACTAQAAAAAAAILEAFFSSISGEMRSFRERHFRVDNQLQRWWNVAERHAAHLSYIIRKDPNLMRAASGLLKDVSGVLREPKSQLRDEHLNDLEAILKGLAETGGRRARIDATRALELLPHLRGRTLDEAIQLLGAVNPSRKPRASRDVSGLLKSNLRFPSSLREPIPRRRE